MTQESVKIRDFHAQNKQETTAIKRSCLRCEWIFLCIFQAIHDEWTKWGNENEKDTNLNKDVVSFVTPTKFPVTRCCNSTDKESYVIRSETVGYWVLRSKFVTLPRSILLLLWRHLAVTYNFSPQASGRL